MKYQQMIIMPVFQESIQNGMGILRTGRTAFVDSSPHTHDCLQERNFIKIG
jgi:hypothetical protein